MYVCYISQGSIKTLFQEDWWFWCHCVPNLFGYMYTNNYSNIKRFDKVIAQIKWCSFLPHSVHYSIADGTGMTSSMGQGIWWRCTLLGSIDWRFTFGCVAACTAVGSLDLAYPSCYSCYFWRSFIQLMTSRNTAVYRHHGISVTASSDISWYTAHR